MEQVILSLISQFTYAISYIEPHMILTAITINILIDIMKPWLVTLPWKNSLIFRVSIYIISIIIMLVMSFDITLRVSPFIDGLITGSLTWFFYDAKIYTTLRDTFQRLTKDKTEK